MSLGSRGSAESTDSVIRIDDSSLLRQQLVIKELENRFLRRQITAQQQEIEQLEASLKQYENPNTPPSKQGGAAKSPSRDNQDGDEDEESEEDDAHAENGILSREKYAHIKHEIGDVLYGYKSVVDMYALMIVSSQFSDLPSDYELNYPPKGLISNDWVVN